jgi:hypothetical protein
MLQSQSVKIRIGIFGGEMKRIITVITIVLFADNLTGLGIKPTSYGVTREMRVEALHM